MSNIFNWIKRVYLFSILMFSLVQSFPVYAIFGLSSDTRGPLQDSIGEVNERVAKVGKTTKKIEGSVNQIEDDTDRLLVITSVIEDKVCQIESDLDDLEVAVSGIDELQQSANSILDKTCEINSKIDDLEVVVTVSGIDELQQSANSILDKTCEINSKIDDLEVAVTVSGIDELEQTANSILDKTCEINSKIDLLEIAIMVSNTDALQSTADSILDKVCNIPACDFVILQSDIDPVNGLVITQPGLYCLGENVDFNATGTVITIQSDCVTFDMHGHAIDGQNVADTGIFVDGASNVMIFDGTIKQVGRGVVVESSDGPVKITNIKVTDLFDSPLSNASILINSSQNIIVTDCHSTRSGSMSGTGFEVVGTSVHCIFSDCTAHDGQQGFVVTDSCSQCVFKNCSSNDQTLRGFEVTGNAAFCTFENCVSGNTQNQAGFCLMDTTSNCVLAFCKTLNSESSIGFGSFEIFGDNNLVEFCSAQASNVNGFSIDGESNIIRHCEAIDNGFDGFRISGNGVNNIIRNCVSTGNVDDGFHIESTATNNELHGNSAVGNGDQGFSNNGIGSKIFNNFANNNVSGNYGGTTGVSLVQKPSDISGYWINADCDATEVGEFESKICAIASIVDVLATP